MTINPVLTRIASEEQYHSVESQGRLKKLEAAIKKRKLDGDKFEVPLLKHEGDKIMFALNLCAEHFPGLLVPHTYLAMMVYGLGAVPRQDSKRVQDLGQRISPKRAKMREKYGRDIFTARGEKACRGTVGREDALACVGVSSIKRVESALQRHNEIGDLIDIENIKITEANRAQVEFWTKRAPIFSRVDKQLKALPKDTSKKPGSK